MLGKMQMISPHFSGGNFFCYGYIHMQFCIIFIGSQLEVQWAHSGPFKSAPAVGHCTCTACHLQWALQLHCGTVATV